jgi:hypothetical protein
MSIYRCGTREATLIWWHTNIRHENECSWTNLKVVENREKCVKLSKKTAKQAENKIIKLHLFWGKKQCRFIPENSHAWNYNSP